jgi:hypothetical protein
MDITNVIKAIREVKSLQNVLFNEYQTKIFRYLTQSFKDQH